MQLCNYALKYEIVNCPHMYFLKTFFLVNKKDSKRRVMGTILRFWKIVLLKCVRLKSYKIEIIRTGETRSKVNLSIADNGVLLRHPTRRDEATEKLMKEDQETLAGIFLSVKPCYHELQNIAWGMGESGIIQKDEFETVIFIIWLKWMTHMNLWKFRKSWPI